MVIEFKEFGASSLDIEIMAWFRVSMRADFQLCRQEVLLGFLKVVADTGSGCGRSQESRPFSSGSISLAALEKPS